MSVGVDPGRAIAWARTPQYSISLINKLATLPESRALAVLGPPTGLNAKTKEQRVKDVAELAVWLFEDGGDLAKRARHQRSTATRIKKLVDDYQVACRDRDQASDYHRPATLNNIRTHQPWFDALDSILSYEFATGRHSGDSEPDNDSDQNSTHSSYHGDHPSGSQHTDDAMQGIELHPPPPTPHTAATPARSPAARRRLIPRPQSTPHNPTPARLPAAGPSRQSLHLLSPEQRFDNTDLAHCPACQARLPPDASEAERHMRDCFGAGVAEAEAELYCPVCDADLSGLENGERERHVEECCRVGTGGAKGGVVVEAYAEFTCDSKSLPKDPATGQVAECVFCFGEYEVGERAVRLSCMCVFHEECVRPWWEEKAGRFCMVHRRDDPPDTMVVG